MSKLIETVYLRRYTGEYSRGYCDGILGVYTIAHDAIPSA